MWVVYTARSSNANFVEIIILLIEYTRQFLMFYNKKRNNNKTQYKITKLHKNNIKPRNRFQIYIFYFYFFRQPILFSII